MPRGRRASPLGPRPIHSDCGKPAYAGILAPRRTAVQPGTNLGYAALAVGGATLQAPDLRRPRPYVVMSADGAQAVEGAGFVPVRLRTDEVEVE